MLATEFRPRGEDSPQKIEREKNAHVPCPGKVVGETEANRSESANFTYLTMFGWSSSFSRDISRIAVQGTPSSSDSKRIRFKATICPVSRDDPK
jgi:hypothetical protein